MPVGIALTEFQARVAQCDSLIANAHRQDASGVALFPLPDRQQITVAAFLNFFVAWEGFLEDVLTKVMAGNATVLGKHPQARYVAPASQNAAKAMVIGINKYFDYANPEFVRRVVMMYFAGGYPFEPHLSSIATDLADLRTMRNASAHISSTTQKALEALAQRVFSTPRPGVDLYTFLTATDPRHGATGTVFAAARDKLLAAASLIANG